ncbi:ATP-binding protein [Nocardiopsis sp. FIRDI 009]|uniref:ATP-binding protein n=1 Tax=Nocardiopsis sp. FIRDI 009 TaxID=714197 RepID=UPI000E27E9C7|nr:ATP-binding protein [Nocardiopsis sp. FIRDI 009]
MITAPQKPQHPTIIRHTFDGTTHAARHARAWARHRLEALGVEPPTDLELILSELATNAVAHSHSGDPGGTLAVRLKVYPDRVRVEVRDAGPLTGRTPTRRTPPLTAQHGRGLLLVDAFSRKWGRLPVGTGMWAEVAR